MKRWLAGAVAVAAGAALSGCSSLYYGAMDKIGVHKRDILIDRVKDARTAQDETKQQFKSAYEQFTAVVKVEGGQLEQEYERLNAQLRACEERAAEVRRRIDAVEDVAGALFREWKGELDDYSNPELRRSSEMQYRRTRGQYTQLVNAMRAAEKRIAPVLQVFRDRVLFLKHNLNAQAIASLREERATVDSDVAALIRELEKAINEADDFIRTLGPA